MFHYSEHPSHFKALYISALAGLAGTTVSAPFWTLKTRLNLYLTEYANVHNLKATASTHGLE